MRVAVLCDIHGNLPALDAVLDEIRDIGVDRIVVGGDVLPGPMPRETMARLLELETPTQFIYGNGDLAILAQLQAASPSEVTYWGTSSGAPLPEPYGQLFRWTAQQVQAYQNVLAGWPLTTTVDIDAASVSTTRAFAVTYSLMWSCVAVAISESRRRPSASCRSASAWAAAALRNSTGTRLTSTKPWNA